MGEPALAGANPQRSIWGAGQLAFQSPPAVAIKVIHMQLYLMHTLYRTSLAKRKPKFHGDVPKMQMNNHSPHTS